MPLNMAEYLYWLSEKLWFLFVLYCKAKGTITVFLSLKGGKFLNTCIINTVDVNIDILGLKCLYGCEFQYSIDISKSPKLSYGPFLYALTHFLLCSAR